MPDPAPSGAPVGASGPPYDVVVVGAGSAGATLAARLSEDPTRTVLLVEAGRDVVRDDGFPPEVLNARSMQATFPGHPDNWTFTGQLTSDINFVVPRGKIIGGSSSINGTYFVRGSRHDFDSLAKAGLSEWSFDEVLPFFVRMEHDLDFGDLDGHGADGPIPVRRPPNPGPITQAFFAACAELGLPEKVDMNSEGSGYGLIPFNSVDGVRVNTAMAYLNPHRDRPNLTVQGDTFVRRVVFEGTSAIGVEVEHGGTTEVIRAGEVVLSAGAFKSPHVLLLSGVGPREQLERFGIPVVHDLPGVGQGFTDHPTVAVRYQPGRRHLHDPASPYFMEGVVQYSSGEEGYDNDLQLMSATLPLSQIMLTTAPGSNVASGALTVLRHSVRTLRSLRGVSIRHLLHEIRRKEDLSVGASIMVEESRGTIELQSADPHVQPVIAANYLSTASDLRRMCQMLRLAVAIVTSRAFGVVKPTITEPGPSALVDDEALGRWARSHLSTSFHACSSCRMGTPDDPGAVVDQHGRVFGVTSLRVADTSILPNSPSAGPAATAIMIGERVADLMRLGPSIPLAGEARS